MEAEWDPAKARSNLAKHGISFADAALVLNDDFAISIPDTWPAEEDRFVALGTDALGRVLVVSYAYRRNTIRIISARRATKSERRQYEKGLRL